MKLSLPTPVRRLAVASEAGQLWIKQDGLTHSLYGGNKMRKASLLLADAARRGAKRILTIGAAGSHHVLATTLFAPEFGVCTAAVLTPQPGTAHARNVLARALGAGLEPLPAASSVAVPLVLARAYRRRDYFIPPGGSNALGAAAYAVAVEELEQQVLEGHMPTPDWIVVPLGSGGTAAGILAGLVRSRLPTRLLAVSVLRNPVDGAWVRLLAKRVLSRLDSPRAKPDWKSR